MPSLTRKLFTLRAAVLLAAASLVAAGAGVLPATASANSSQIAIFQDGGTSYGPTTASTLAEMRSLGASTVRIFLPWAVIAPGYASKRKPAFNAADPGAYKGGWDQFDTVIRDAAADHMTVDLTVSGGAPTWAEGPGMPRNYFHNLAFAWKPNASDFGQFVTAAGKRYSGHYTPAGSTSPLPRVHFWAIYNEPNFGQDLGPQMISNTRTPYAPMAFRSLLNAGWKALHNTGHGGDTIIWGEFAAHGTTVVTPFDRAYLRLPGDAGQTKPIEFVRMLYCLDSSYRPLRGVNARALGCPASNAASRGFRRANPALFSASGVSDHPYAITASPVSDGVSDPDYATFPNLGRFATALDRSARTYGARPRFPIYNTEYGYITNPPHPPDNNGRYASWATASTWINWAEYLSYKNSRIKSYMQYLLTDPSPTTGAYSGFASGLQTYKGQHKSTYDAYRMPVFMPTTSFSRRRKVEVWGAARPAPFAAIDGFTPATVQIQLRRGRSWTTVATTGTHGGGYFDVRIQFPASGLVRLQWTYPADPMLPKADDGTTIHSRSFAISVH